MTWPKFVAFTDENGKPIFVNADDIVHGHPVEVDLIDAETPDERPLWGLEFLLRGAGRDGGPAMERTHRHYSLPTAEDAMAIAREIAQSDDGWCDFDAAVRDFRDTRAHIAWAARADEAVTAILTERGEVLRDDYTPHSRWFDPTCIGTLRNHVVVNAISAPSSLYQKFLRDGNFKYIWEFGVTDDPRIDDHIDGEKVRLVGRHGEFVLVAMAHEQRSDS